MPRKGGLRIGLIYKLMDAYLYALSGDNYRLAGTHLYSVATFLKVNIPQLPLNDSKTPSEALSWMEYCIQNEPKVLRIIGDNLTKYSEKANPLQVMHGDDDEGPVIPGDDD